MACERYQQLASCYMPSDLAVWRSNEEGRVADVQSFMIQMVSVCNAPLRIGKVIERTKIKIQVGKGRCR